MKSILFLGLFVSMFCFSAELYADSRTEAKLLSEFENLKAITFTTNIVNNNSLFGLPGKTQCEFFNPENEKLPTRGQRFEVYTRVASMDLGREIIPDGVGIFLDGTRIYIVCHSFKIKDVKMALRDVATLEIEKKYKMRP